MLIIYTSITNNYICNLLQEDETQNLICLTFSTTNITHQNNVAMSSPTPIQSTNITYKRNLTKPQKPSLSTKAKPTEDAEKQ
jgi:hypothetical protein